MRDKPDAEWRDENGHVMDLKEAQKMWGDPLPKLPKVSASTERVWRAIYERIVFGGEPVAEVLADYAGGTMPVAPEPVTAVFSRAEILEDGIRGMMADANRRGDEYTHAYLESALESADILTGAAKTPSQPQNADRECFVTRDAARQLIHDAYQSGCLGDGYTAQVADLDAIAITPQRRVVDDPSFDATDGAHPAWWRGHEYTTAAFCERVHAILDGEPLAGVSNDPWQSLRFRLAALAPQGARP